MKVIKIIKNYRSGSIEHHLVLDDMYDNEEIQDFVIEWCEDDPSGSNYGYTYNWTIEDNDDIIENILQKKIGSIKMQISLLETKMNNMIDSTKEGIRRNKLESL